MGQDMTNLVRLVPVCAAQSSYNICRFVQNMCFSSLAYGESYFLACLLSIYLASEGLLFTSRPSDPSGFSAQLPTISGEDSGGA